MPPFRLRWAGVTVHAPSPDSGQELLSSRVKGAWPTLRQQVDGPQAEQLELVPCGQILQEEEEEELSPAQVNRDRDHIFLILEVKETFPTTRVQKGSLEGKKGVMSTYP